MQLEVNVYASLDGGAVDGEAFSFGLDECEDGSYDMVFNRWLDDMFDEQPKASFPNLRHIRILCIHAVLHMDVSLPVPFEHRQ